MIKPTKKIKILLTSIILAILVVAVLSAITQIKTPKKVTPSVEELAKPTAQVAIGKTIEFKVKDPTGKEIVLKFTLVDAKRVGYITKANQPVQLPPNNDIMVVSLELQNDSKYAMKVNSRDFIRMVGDADKKYAADFYNGDIDVTAISVVKDELAFVVPNNKKQFKLQVGEIDKEKQDVEIKFP